jgi:hypothetical protein
VGPQKPVPHFPPPWALSGEGIILVYKFPPDWVHQNACLTEDQAGKFKGGLGYVMLVHYAQSPVGPYKELLLIPGKFYPHRRQAITKIFVDTQVSTDNGRYNWGIPKETTSIAWHSEGNRDTITVGSETAPALACAIRCSGPAFPISTRLLPIRLHQVLDGATFRTSPVGRGWGRWSRVEKLVVDPHQFPDISRFQPLVSIRVSPFHLFFPETQLK